MPRRFHPIVACLGFTLSLAWQEWASAEVIRVAVASNFASTAGALAEVYERNSGHRILLSAASTGKHYAQIRAGAPFAVFLAADQARPERLEQEGLTQPGTRFTYALGRLVLWSPIPDFVDAAGEVLNGDEFRYLAIANPELAPYGRAAREVLEHRQAWTRLQTRIVRGENISQAHQFVVSGAAELGFLAAAQVRDLQGSRWNVPASLHAPIRQQAVLLRPDDPAREFLDFIRTEAGRNLIRAAGYDTP